MSTTDLVRAEVEAANLAFYTAFEDGDLDAMRAVWADDPGTVCVHPGSTVLTGTGAILRSWALLMAHTAYIQFVLTDVEVALPAGTRELATVTCTENVLTGDERSGPQVFGGGRAVATNVFVRTGEGWRLWAHHASPVLTGVGGGDD